MKLVWSPQARHDLVDVYSCIFRDDPVAARAVIERIISLIEKLPDTPHLGRPGRVQGTRELVVSGTPFIVPYRGGARTLQIVRVYHAARRWPPAF